MKMWEERTLLSDGGPPQYRVCVHCDELEPDHADEGKCLFQASSFSPKREALINHMGDPMIDSKGKVRTQVVYRSRSHKEVAL